MRVSIGDLVVLNKTPDAILWRVCEIDGHGVGLIDTTIEHIQPEIQLIDAENIRRISYIGVGNTSDITQASYYGAPQTDKLILRSK